MDQFEQKRLEQKQRDLQAEWDLRTSKLAELSEALAVEASATVRFQLKHQIQAEQAAINKIESELDQIEQKLEAGPGPFDQKRVVGLDVLRAVPVWVGRDQLLKQLQAEFVEAEEPHPIVLALVGQGGIGKTSLAVKLLEAVGVNLQRAELAASSVYAGVICLRADEGISFDEVVGFLLKALGLEMPERVDATQKIKQVIRGLQQQRYLVLLDNLEVVLHPASNPEAGRTLQPELGQLLNALVYSPHQSQIIVTSREVPADLADPRSPGAEPDSVLVQIERLGGVDRQAGAEILEKRQLKDSEADRLWVAERVEGHVFVLTQLAAVARGKPGYLRQHPELVTKQAKPILQVQLARQSEPARELLKRMCVLRVGIDIKGLTFLRLYQDEAPGNLTKADIQATQELVNRLVVSCLVQCRYDQHKCEDVYDLHRLIVEFLQAEYQTELPDLLKRVYSFYRTGKTIDNPKTLEDLRPLLEAQHFAFQLGNYNEAASLVMHQIEKYLQPWGHWNLLKNLYLQILPNVSEEDSPYWLQRIGSRYRDFGDWNEAETYFQKALVIAKKYQHKSLIAGTTGQLGDIERNLGNWDRAEQLYRQCLQIEEELGDRSGMATSWGQLGDIERNRGNWDRAEQLYRQSLQIREELGDRSGMAISWGLLGDVERNRDNWDRAKQIYYQCLQTMEELGDRSGIAVSISCLGTTELERGNLDAAEPLLQESLVIMQEVGMLTYIAEVNYDLARLERQRGNSAKAQQYYTIAHDLFTRLGAAKDLERIEGEWQSD